MTKPKWRGRRWQPGRALRGDQGIDDGGGILAVLGQWAAERGADGRGVRPGRHRTRSEGGEERLRVPDSSAEAGNAIRHRKNPTSGYPATEAS
jgi:hypothetical protein